jgi:hypothetical protein
VNYREEIMASRVDVAQLKSLLANPSLKTTDLRALIKNIEPLKQLKPVRGFPLGTPEPFAVRTRFDLTTAAARKLSDSLMGATDPAIRGWRVFPIGIVNPQRWVVEVDIGQPRSV